MPAFQPGATGVIRRGPQQAWTPLNLGASLYDMWDAEQAGTISLSGSAVTSWLSVKNAYSAAQAVGASRPIYSATSFNSRPGITFDASDDQLTYGGVGVFPVGAAACEIWALVDQTVAGAVAGTLRILAYGGITNNDSRFMSRSASGGVNVLNLNVGNGGASVGLATSTSAPFDGRHVCRAIIDGANAQVILDAAASGVAAVTPATGTTMTRIGLGTAGVGYFGGVMSLLAITAPLSATQAAQMSAYLKARGNTP